MSRLEAVKTSGSRSPGQQQFVLALGGFAIGTTEFTSMSLLPFYSRDLGLTAARGGHAISLYALGVVVGAPSAALLFGRVPRRTLLIGFMLVFALGNLLASLSTSYVGLLAARFGSGLPHGAYFGEATLLAARATAPARRAQSVAQVMLGLTVATVIGVPAANMLGHLFGWRWVFRLVAAMALGLALLMRFVVPPARSTPSVRSSCMLADLRSVQIWLTLLTGAVGFGGIFAVYTYLASTILVVTQAGANVIPLMLAVFGVGLTAGNLICGWAADRASMTTIGATLAFSAGVLALYPVAAHNLWTMFPVVLLVGCGGGLGTAVQARLIDIAGEAQGLVAAMNQSAFNMANALGAQLAGLTLTVGFGLEFSGYVGTALAVAALLPWAVSS